MKIDRRNAARAPQFGLHPRLTALSTPATTGLRCNVLHAIDSGPYERE